MNAKEFAEHIAAYLMDEVALEHLAVMGNLSDEAVLLEVAYEDGSTFLVTVKGWED